MCGVCGVCAYTVAAAAERLVRMIVRDCTGKYVWDFDLSYDLFKSKEPILPPAAIVPNLLPAKAAEVVVKRYSNHKLQTIS